MNAVDTNILIYAHDPRDPEKQSRAEALISSFLAEWARTRGLTLAEAMTKLGIHFPDHD